MSDMRPFKALFPCVSKPSPRSLLPLLFTPLAVNLHDATDEVLVMEYYSAFYGRKYPLVLTTAQSAVPDRTE